MPKSVLLLTKNQNRDQFTFVIVVSLPLQNVLRKAFWLFSKCQIFLRLAFFVATVATDSAVFVATLPVSQIFWLSLLFYFGIGTGSHGTLPRCAQSRTLFGL